MANLEFFRDLPESSDLIFHGLGKVNGIRLTRDGRLFANGQEVTMGVARGELLGEWLYDVLAGLLADHID